MDRIAIRARPIERARTVLDFPARVAVSFAGRQATLVSAPSGAERCSGPDRARLRRQARDRLSRQAQEALGLISRAVGKDRHGAPVWPPGQSGSFSHCGGISVCLLSPGGTDDWGVDLEATAEPDTRDAILENAMTHEERALLGDDLARQATSVFSAKESFYKAAFPRVGQSFGFEALQLVAPPGAKRLRFALACDLAPDLPAGHDITVCYRVFATAVLTWTALTKARAVPP